MTGLMMTFVAAFVLVVGVVCGLVVLRSLGNLELPESPPFPRARTRYHRPVRDAGPPEASRSESHIEELAEKR